MDEVEEGNLLIGLLTCGATMSPLSRTGPISSVTVLGQTIVIINDAKLAFELLEKRSAKHSSRPKQVFAGEL